MDNNTNIIFADNLRHWLSVKHKSQVFLAEEMGVSEAAVSHWCKGTKLPRTDKIKRICELLRIDMSDLLEPRNRVKIATSYNLPIFASCSAGFGAYGDNEIIGYFPYNARSEQEASEMLCVIVEGDSMSPEIKDGDTLIVRRQTSIDSGDTAIVRIDEDTFFVKEVIYDANSVTLHSVNPYYPDKKFEGNELLRVNIVGKVLGRYSGI
jgi:repressor LexA